MQSKHRMEKTDKIYAAKENGSAGPASLSGGHSQQNPTDIRILVTGSHGFVGTVLLEELRKSFPRVELLTPTSKELNLLDYKQTEDFLQTHPVDCIIHLAAQHGCVSLVSNKQLEMLEVNLMINYNIVHAAMRTGIKKFIALGSSCSYSAEASLPCKEEDLWHGYPENTYGVCKLVLLDHLSNQKDMNWVYFVPANLYGARDHFGGENMHIIPATVMKFQDALLNGKEEIEVWGDGSQTRDFIYIDDLVHFLVAALTDERYEKKVLNIGTGVEISVRELVEAIRKEMGAEDKIKIRWAPDKPTGILRKALSNEKLMELSPGYKFVQIDEGLARTIRTFKEKGNA